MADWAKLFENMLNKKHYFLFLHFVGTSGIKLNHYIFYKAKIHRPLNDQHNKDYTQSATCF